jgi:hypothetical protein
MHRYGIRNLFTIYDKIYFIGLPLCFQKCPNNSAWLIRWRVRTLSNGHQPFFHKNICIDLIFSI